MSKTKTTASEVQLKARRTSLGKKSNEELINIILRKDKSERKMNSKIQELTNLLKEADELNEEKATRILNVKKDMDDIVKTKQEQIDKLISDNLKLRDDSAQWCKKYVDCKNISNIRRKIMLTCFGVIAILIILLFLS